MVPEINPILLMWEALADIREELVRARTKEQRWVVARKIETIRDYLPRPTRRF